MKLDADRTRKEPPLIPDVIEREPGAGDAGEGWGGQSNGRDGAGDWLFGPRNVGGGRVHVYGCSPGCLLISLIVSVIASLVLTFLLNVVF